MMKLVHYNPWGLLDELHGAFDGFPLSLQVRPAGDCCSPEAAHWSPAVDIHEEPSRFVLRSDLPGINPEDIELTVERGVLTIRGERTVDRKSDADGYSRVERVHGAFQRRIGLPETADPDHIEARYDRGVLEVVLRKKEQDRPRKVHIEQQH
jgi:HSP20 family protein